MGDPEPIECSFTHPNTTDNTLDDKEEPYYFDPSDCINERTRCRKAFHLTMDFSTFVCNAQVDSFLDDLDHTELLGYHEPFDTYAFAMQAWATIKDAEALQPFLAWRPLEVIQRTLENTTQLACICYDHALQMHHKPWFPWLNQNCLHETVATNTMFALIPDISSHTCAQVYWGLTSHFINVYGMRTESNGPQYLDDFAREEGVPPIMHSDNSHMQQ